jgi:MOSC domain-containing protein YiiM
MGEDWAARITEIRIYPVKDEPGQALQSVEVETEGLAGDRRKKSPLHLVSIEEDVATQPRANLVVDTGAERLAAAVGQRLRLGEAEILITGMPSSCPGVYATVAVPGAVRLGDALQTTAGQGESAAPRP